MDVTFVRRSTEREGKDGKLAALGSLPDPRDMPAPKPKPSKLTRAASERRLPANRRLPEDRRQFPPRPEGRRLGGRRRGDPASD
jgi:hypothetical protein